MTYSHIATNVTASDGEILMHLRTVLKCMYGDRLNRVVLYGSRARGDAGPDSDYDVAVFLTALPDRWVELDNLAELRVRLMEDTGIFLDAKPYPADAYHERTPLMHEIRREGRDL